METTYTAVISAIKGVDRGMKKTKNIWGRGENDAIKTVTECFSFQIIENSAQASLNFAQVPKKISR